MILGVVLMGLIALGAIASIVVPLWRTPAQPGVLPAESNLAVWRQEREEILREASNGALSEAERELALAELSERAAGEIKSDRANPRLARRPSRALAILLGGGLVVFAVVLYAKLGHFDALSGAALAAAQREGEEPGANDPRIIAMVDSLTKKLESHPDDLEGWSMLGRSQMVLMHYQEAAQAYAKAVSLAPPDAQLLADYADALAMAQGRRLEGKPAELVMRAVELDPTNLKALELAGTVALSKGDTAAALSYWTKLRQLLPADSDDAREVDAALTNLRARLAQSQTAPGASAAKSPGAPVGTSGAQKSAPRSGAASESVAGQIDVLPALAGKVALNDTVFIFARALPNAPGASKMPLAVLRFAARELPKSFELGDAQAMVPDQKISGQSAVVVQARISKSGSAQAASGDLESPPMTVKPGNRGLAIVISQVVP
jgi:cytochrome c-type biogenesis protein CcmH